MENTSEQAQAYPVFDIARLIACHLGHTILTNMSEVLRHINLLPTVDAATSWEAVSYTVQRVEKRN